MIVGFYFSLGYLFFPPRIQKYLKPISQIAFVLPSIYSILICLSLITYFPFGHVGVIFIFSIIHLGFSTVYIAEVLQSKTSGFAIVAEVYNLNKLTFFLRVIIPLIWRDLLILGLIIFLNCISSLAIPLLVGGGKGTNLEVYIYEKIFIDQQWTQALYLGFIQSCVLFLVSLFIFKKQQRLSGVRSYLKTDYLGSKSAATFLLVYILLYVGGYLFKTASILTTTDLSTVFDSEFVSGFFNSVLIFIGVSVMMSVFLVGVAYSVYKNRRYNWIYVFTAPSTVLVGFSAYLLFPVNHLFFDIIKIISGLFLLFFVSLYLMYISEKLESGREQGLLCQIYNINFIDFLIKILWPQIRLYFIFVISLIYLLSVSEFAFIQASGAQLNTLGTLTESYLSSYRMNQAYVISFFSLSTSGLLYFFLWRLCARHQKS